VPSLIIIFLVVVTSRGPILFTQKRVGKNGRTFNVLKFRTMQAGTHTAIITDDAELARYQDNGFKVQPDDPRITSVGRVLRKSSLDEIPQLVNVFWGDMSIVGIRPLLPEELALRSERDQMLYRMLRPGMTGLWQVEGRSHVEQVDRVGLDRTYIESWSLGSDLWIMLRTPFALLKVGNTH
jgi:lipopolysaccharide/colanic/teichoic acid biosynthesis glycosyltransferase